jgi:hypothetical protein
VGKHEAPEERQPNDFRPNKRLGDPVTLDLKEIGDEYIKQIKSDPDAPQKSSK